MENVKTALWHLREALYVLGWLRPPVPERATFLRLYRTRRGTREKQPGSLRFPFGTISYVDFQAMLHQYDEIFVQGAYDFVADTDSPFILDCGGHIGLSVIRFKSLYPHARIVTFEPDPIIADVLRRNLLSLHLESVELMQAAAWVENGWVLFEPDGRDGGRVRPMDGRIRVPAIRLADYIQQPVDLLKLDIEGAEYEVLLDLCETDKICLVKRIICEFHIRAEAHVRLGQVLLKLALKGFSLSFGKGAPAPQMPGNPEPTPFRSLPDGKSLLLLYAWKERANRPEA